MVSPVIAEKLESLRHCIQRIEGKCPADPGLLAKDLDIQDIVTLNLTRAVQLCVDIATHILSRLDGRPPDTMGSAFDSLAESGVLEETTARSLKKAVGFRNIAIHNYERINWNIVFAICTEHLEDFRSFARQVTGKGL